MSLGASVFRDALLLISYLLDLIVCPPDVLPFNNIPPSDLQWMIPASSMLHTAFLFALIWYSALSNCNNNPLEFTILFLAEWSLNPASLGFARYVYQSFFTWFDSRFVVFNYICQHLRWSLNRLNYPCLFRMSHTNEDNVGVIQTIIGLKRPNYIRDSLQWMILKWGRFSKWL